MPYVRSGALTGPPANSFWGSQAAHRTHVFLIWGRLARHYKPRTTLAVHPETVNGRCTTRKRLGNSYRLVTTRNVADQPLSGVTD
jgi:hypothetical protein